jgi:ribosome-associated protein
MTDTSAKRDVQKLQRAIVDGLEDVKAQDIVVFNTEHMSPLFERVVIASGTSNRQTKALAASVRDKIREAGFPKPRIEGEDNGEWIIVDCGPAVVHVMQPAIRQYYHLEEIWGEKPVRLKHGSEKVALVSVAKNHVAKPASANSEGASPSIRKRTTSAGKPAAAKTAARQAPAKKSAQPKPAAKGATKAKPAAKKSAGAKPAPRSAPRKAPARKA